MARSRRRQPKRAQPPAFYEAVGSPLPASTLNVTDQFRVAVATLGEAKDHATAQAAPKLAEAYRGLLRLGLATSETVLNWTRSTRLAAAIAFDATRHYGPAVLGDVRAYSRRTRHRLLGRQARGYYLLLSGIAALGLATFATISATNTLRSYAADISTPVALMSKKKTGITILDRNGVTLYRGYGADTATPIKLATMPTSLKDATLAAEDPSFYDHPGISWRGTMRAIITDIAQQRKAEGGSTLTQQLVKNALLTSDKKLERKYQEILLAMELERQYSKDEILEMYLNETYYGQGSAGVEAASQTYFHKPASELTLSESALLAGLPLGPSRFDPNVDPEAAVGRRNFVLGRMAEIGKITPEQAALAKASPLTLEGTPEPVAGATMIYAKKISIEAPHFVFYILDQLRAQYGTEEVENGGMTIRTTLDTTKQSIAEQAVAQRISELSYNHVTNGGLISLEPKSGDILAMVGSVDYNAPGFGNVNVTLSQLQPGSSFKPIAYATAFKKGWNGASHVDDVPMSVPSGDGTIYSPQNYDLKFRGSVSLRQALANSLNIPAIKVLQFAGIHETVQTAHDLGLGGLNDESRLGLSMVLGSNEVRPIDMATVYATFANAGTRVNPRSILSVTDRYGKDITKTKSDEPKNVLDPRIAYMITNILSDNAARTPEFGPNSPLKLSRPAAAKTGTTNDFRDNWTVGYTPSLATAVWVGNNDHSAMSGVDGITGAAPIWHDYMERALIGTPVEQFIAPVGITMAAVCADGGLANPWDAVTTEAFLTEAMPTKRCNSQPPRPVVTPGEDPAQTEVNLRDLILSRLRGNQGSSGPGN